MTTTNTFTKDPAAVLDYAWDWKALTNGTPGGASDWLASGETITAHTVTTSSAALVVDSSTESGGKITAWLSGGAAGSAYDVTCQITTSAGRTDERSIIVHVLNR